MVTSVFLPLFFSFLYYETTQLQTNPFFSLFPNDKEENTTLRRMTATRNITTNRHRRCAFILKLVFPGNNCCIHLDSNYVPYLLISTQSSPTQHCFTVHKRRRTSAPLCPPPPETTSLHLHMCRVTEEKNVCRMRQ